jgi:hypothetical protein
MGHSNRTILTCRGFLNTFDLFKKISGMSNIRYPVICNVDINVLLFNMRIFRVTW